jgi:hypothetical protein
MKIRTKAPNFALTQSLAENLAGPHFGERIYDVNIEKYPILSC